jgi:hypothetical protein
MGRRMSGPKPHDTFFQAIFALPENVVGELRAVLPADVLEAIDLRQVTVEQTSFVDPALRKHHVDRLARVRVKGRDVYVYVLLEHQSTVDPLMPVRVFVYIARFWSWWIEAHPEATRVPAVIPILVHQGPGAWTGPRTLSQALDLPGPTRALLGQLLPQLTLLVDDLGVARVEDLAARPLGALGRVGLVLLHAARARGAPIRQAIATVAEQFRTLSADALEQTVRYLRTGAKLPDRELVELVDRYASPAAVEAVMPKWTELLDEKLAEGRVEGVRSLLTRLLRARFGDAVSPAVLARLDSADTATLERWAERVLTAARLSDVLDG